MTTERRCPVISNLASYYGGPGLKSRPRDRLSCLGIHGFYQSLQENSGLKLEIKPQPLASASFPVKCTTIPVASSGAQGIRETPFYFSFFNFICSR
jgi:hypothetical protein